MEVSESFKKSLRAYDSTLDAVLDDRQDCIHIFSCRKGNKIHELSIKRGKSEMWNVLERRILKVLPEKDVWKRFKNADEYDDHLHEKEQALCRQKREKAKAERWGRFKDEINLWKHALAQAQKGIFRGGDPYRTNSIISGHEFTKPAGCGFTKPTEAKKELILP